MQILDSGKDRSRDWYPEDVLLSELAGTLAAMANTGGGEVLLGASPRGGHIQGVHNPAASRDKVFQAALALEPTLVLPVPRLVELQGQSVLWIVVPPGLPNAYSYNGRYLGRKGARNEPLGAAEVRQLLVERGEVLFEARRPAGASLDDLDLDQVQRYLAVTHFDPAPWEKVLLQRGCLKQEGEQYWPTYAGLLLFGKTPQQWLPSATVLAAHFEGDSFSDQFVKREFTGTLPEQLRQAFAFVANQMPQEVRLQGLEHQTSEQFPEAAVRELLVNAVAHRDYNLQGDCIHINIFADRLEIHSPGRLPGPVTLENLLQARFSRNPVIMQVLSDLGFVERLGYGLDRVVAAARARGLPPPEFSEVAGTFRAALRARTFTARPQAAERLEISGVELNDRQRVVVQFLAENRRVTNSDYQTLCPDVHPETLRRDLADLVRQGVLIKIGQKKATYYVLKN